MGLDLFEEEHGSYKGRHSSYGEVGQTWVNLVSKSRGVGIMKGTM